jgi:hypothetical protein
MQTMRTGGLAESDRRSSRCRRSDGWFDGHRWRLCGCWGVCWCVNVAILCDVWPQCRPTRSSAGLNTLCLLGSVRSAVPAFRYPPLRFSQVLHRGLILTSLLQVWLCVSTSVVILERQDRGSKRSILRLRTEDAATGARAGRPATGYPCCVTLKSASPVSSLALYSTGPAEPRSAPGQVPVRVLHSRSIPSFNTAGAQFLVQCPRTQPTSRCGWLSNSPSSSRHRQLTLLHGRGQLRSSKPPAVALRHWRVPRAAALGRVLAALARPCTSGSSPAGSVQVHDQTSRVLRRSCSCGAPGSACCGSCALQPMLRRPLERRTSTPQTGTCSSTHAAGHVTPSVAGVLAGHLHGHLRGVDTRCRSHRTNELVQTAAPHLSVGAASRSVGDQAGSVKFLWDRWGGWSTRRCTDQFATWGGEAVQHLRSFACAAARRATRQSLAAPLCPAPSGSAGTTPGASRSAATCGTAA